ncbi:MAG: hypothetical protein C0412_07920 [Flavobacterium sp.]|nr:hypothetical protein [Flavobacterium sp.]
MKSNIYKFHFYLLIFLITHFVISKLTGYGFSQQIVFGLKIILYISGFIFFFLSLKPFKKVTIYFSYYFVTPIIALLGYVFGGVFLVGILGSILLFPVYPKEKAFEKKDIIVYHKFQGFLGACCSYEIYQKKFGIFEKHLKDIKIDGGIDFKKDTYWFLEDKSPNEL